MAMMTRMVIQNYFSSGPDIKCFVIYLDFSFNNCRITSRVGTNNYSSCDTFEFDQGHKTKNQSITVLVFVELKSTYITNIVSDSPITTT